MLIDAAVSLPSSTQLKLYTGISKTFWKKVLEATKLKQKHNYIFSVQPYCQKQQLTVNL